MISRVIMPENPGKILDAVLRSHFPSFLRKVFSTLSPGQSFEGGWPIDAMAYQIDRVLSGEERRLIVNLPPRSLKSIAFSVALPAFALGLNPRLRIICVSYSIELAKKLANDFRAVVESDWYRRIFPGTRIGRFKNTETEIEFTERGYRLAVSVQGTLTGRGGDLIVIDDPIKPTDAMSEPLRTSVNQWYLNTLLSRLEPHRARNAARSCRRPHRLRPRRTERLDRVEVARHRSWPRACRNRPWAGSRATPGGRSLAGARAPRHPRDIPAATGF
jgi:hypothetical protein